jgi:hypothetical protein
MRPNEGGLSAAPNAPGSKGGNFQARSIAYTQAASTAAFGRFLHRPFLADCTHSALDQKAAVETTKTVRRRRRGRGPGARVGPDWGPPGSAARQSPGRDDHPHPAARARPLGPSFGSAAAAGAGCGRGWSGGPGASPGPGFWPRGPARSGGCRARRGGRRKAVKVVKAVPWAAPPSSPPLPPLPGRRRGDSRPAGAWPGAALTAFTTFFGARGEIVGPVRFVSQNQGRGACVF